MKAPQACEGKERLFAYFNHTLSPREETRVKAHLASCASCRGVVAGYSRLDSVLEEWKPVEPSPWFDARARARMASGAPVRPRLILTGFGWRRWSGVAAAAILVVVTSLVALRPSRMTRPGGVVPIAAMASLSRASAMPTPMPKPQTAAVNSEEDATVAQSQPASQEMDLYRNLKVLENYDMLANFDVLSELPQAGSKTND